MGSHLWLLAEEPNPVRPLAQALFQEGFAGVSFFFMLSGFILVHTYGPRLRDGSISRARYLALRVARIAPLHWVLAVPLGVVALVRGAAWGPVLANWALVQSWVPSSAWYFSLVGPSWSLSDEAFFYTAFAGLVLLSRRALGWLGVAMIAADVAMVAGLMLGGRGAVAVGDAQTLTYWLIYILPVTRLTEFVIGMWIRGLSGLWARLWRPTVLEVGVVVLLAGAMVGCRLGGVPDAVRFQLAYMPFMALVLRVYAAGQGAVSRWLARRRWLVLLGDASFALYLIHLPVIQFVSQRWENMDDQPPVLLVALGLVVGCVGLSVVVYRLVEVPLLRIVRREVERIFAR